MEGGGETSFLPIPPGRCLHTPLTMHTCRPPAARLLHVSFSTCALFLSHVPPSPTNPCSWAMWVCRGWSLPWLLLPLLLLVVLAGVAC